MTNEVNEGFMERLEENRKNQRVNVTSFESTSIGAGTVVTLKTGGPAMVVSERSTDKACCHWHEESGELNTMWIPMCCLKVRT